MIVLHKLQAYGRCPIDGAVDVYDIEIKVRRVLKVEDILSVVDRLTRNPVLQEDFTFQMAFALKADVQTTCAHSGVVTVCRT